MNSRMWFSAKLCLFFGFMVSAAQVAFGDTGTVGGPLSMDNLKWAAMFIGIGLAWGDLRAKTTARLDEHARRLDRLEEDR